MQKIIKQVDKERGIVQITTPDERWYIRESKDKITGLPIIEYVPSVTWVAHFYYKSPRLIKWIADQGWDEAEAIKRLAGTRGSKVHQAVEQINLTGEVAMEAKFENKDTGKMEELSLEEYFALVTYTDWFNSVRPEILKSEIVVWNDEYDYAGTVDLVCKINGELWIVDLKTSSDVWPDMELQVSAYKHADYPGLDLLSAKLAILQLGYKRNKTHKFRFNEVEDKYNLFLSVKDVWTNECKDISPKSIELPLVARINTPAVETKVKTPVKTNGKVQGLRASGKRV